jgi:hypothetical protein
MTRSTFVVGRRTAKAITLLVLQKAEPTPIAGPWTLTAVVSPS